MHHALCNKISLMLLRERCHWSPLAENYFRAGVIRKPINANLPRLLTMRAFILEVSTVAVVLMPSGEFLVHACNHRQHVQLFTHFGSICSHIRSDPKLDRNNKLEIPSELTSSLVNQLKKINAASEKAFGVSSGHLPQRLSEQSDFAVAMPHLTPKGSLHEQTNSSATAVQTEPASSIGSHANVKLADTSTAPIMVTNLAALTSSPGRMLRKLDNFA